MSCCSMRRKTVQYRVFDRTGHEVTVTRSHSTALSLAVRINGRFQEEWVDDGTP